MVMADPGPRDAQSRCEPLALFQPEALHAYMSLKAAAESCFTPESMWQLVTVGNCKGTRVPGTPLLTPWVLRLAFEFSSARVEFETPRTKGCIRIYADPTSQMCIIIMVVLLVDRPKVAHAAIRHPPKYMLLLDVGQSFPQSRVQSPVSSQAIRPCPPVQARIAHPPAPAASPALQKASVTGGPVAAPQQPPTVITGGQSAPQAQPQPAPQPAPPAQTTTPAVPASPGPGAPVVSQEMQENVKKCKNFLATLIKLASHNSPSPETSKNVKALVQDLLDAKIEPEEFTSRLQTELKSSPQPYLVPFLKKSLPALRLSLLSSQQSLTQPPPQVKPAPGVPLAGASTVPTIVAGPTVRVRQPNSGTLPAVLPGAAHGNTATLGIKRAVTQGAQVGMPMVVTQTVRAPGVVGKGPAIPATKSPVGMAAQVSANVKNKLNDPGGGSFRDDDDINDVASMAGVNLNEESARILATNSELVGTQIRSCKDEAFLPVGLLHRRILETAKKFGVTEVPVEAVTFISHATQARLRSVLEKVSTIAQHRMETCKLERLEKQRKDEQEREILLKAAKRECPALQSVRTVFRVGPLVLGHDALAEIAARNRLVTQSSEASALLQLSDTLGRSRNTVRVAMVAVLKEQWRCRTGGQKVFLSQGRPCQLHRWQ
ncbi:hypothetical protein Z043_114263 [Scleropages formosus]|uniref:TAFH domain-containing protein n=1 Tax=Scleropages formosus TaxID=113540 RepID=A0A0P7TZU5_SCLFO|nr:hypothetical protein Z043_114263 [Scleropages formosus]